MNKKGFAANGVLFAVLFAFAANAGAQVTDSSRSVRSYTGLLTVTNKGISTIPSFTLGRPAATVDLIVSGKRLSFEPQFRVALEDGKPWSFIFRWRYRAIQKKKVNLRFGAQPVLSFRTRTFDSDGTPEDVIEARRYLASEMTFNYTPAPRVTLGTYYLYSHGIDPSSNRNTHYVGLNLGLVNVPVAPRLTFSLVPQIYYLRIVGDQGFYVMSRFSLDMADFPLSLQAIVNKTIDSEIAGDDFLWNVSLLYAFRF
ncbi:MAG: hypothetical protein R2834_06550 [Rhodothermales bacterium]